MKSRIMGVGHYLPEKILTNEQLEAMVDTSDEWITTRTGIKERRISAPDEFASHMGTIAARRALEHSGVAAADIDLIIVSTITEDMLCPSVACMIQNEIGAVRAAAFDVNAACTGSVYILAIADQFIRTGFYKNILLVSAETLSKIVDWEDRSTCILFGDGAGAMVLSAQSEGGVLGVELGADGSAGRCLTIPGLNFPEWDLEKRNGKKSRTIYMEGTEVFKFAVKTMAEATNSVIKKAGITMDDISLIIPHQANSRIIDGAIKRLKVNRDKMFTNLHKYGNMSSPSITVALSEAVGEGRIKRGDNILLVGFGGGLTWGAAIIQY